MDLEQLIRDVYAGPLEEFVRRRDGAAKALRANKEREAADRVKALRKPGRAAAALNALVHAGGAEIERLAEAITAAQAAHAAGVDVRAALERVRSAVREVAHAAAREGIRLSTPIEAASLVAAVNAVIGDATAFANLRAGCLADIPEAGGMDFLTVIDMAPRALTPAPKIDAHEQAVAALQLADDQLRQAEEKVTACEAKLAAAERELERAKSDVESSRAALVCAREAAEAAAQARAQAARALDLVSG